MFNSMKLRSKLFFIGVVVTLIPLIIILATVLSQNKKVVQVGEQKSLELAYADLEHIVDNLYTLAESHQEVTQKNIDTALRVAKDLMTKAGQISFAEETIGWEAKNQSDKKIQKVTLPKMMLGSQWLGQIAEPSESTPLVDPVQKLLEVTCTIFQRMNPQGDMLRVATNVVNKEGKRAIGTYLPAVEQDGNNNPVVQSILRGEVFKGRAFVVNAWYITAYEPIYDTKHEVIGMLYVGIPQENVKNLRQAIMDMKIGKTGHVTVIDSAGSYVISPQGRQDGVDMKNEKDTEGRAYIQDRIAAAKILGTRIAGSQKFSVKDSAGASVTRESRFIYFKPWDWIVTAEANQSEFTDASNKIADINRNGTFILGLVGTGAVVLTGLVWLFMANSIVKPLKRVIVGLKDVAEGDLTKRLTTNGGSELGELASSANNLGKSFDNMCTRVECSSSTINASAHNLDTLSSSLFSATEIMSGSCNTVATAAEQMNSNMLAIASSAEETSINVSMVAAATEEMTTTITEIAAGSEKARVITMQAVQEAEKASVRVQELGEAAREINKVTETINAIADQTNLLALNATIEAARAGEAGKGFAVVANEIKELAKQTTEATREIQERIESVQNSSNLTITVINNITNIINDTSEIVSSMAAAVEEQAVTSREIASNVNQASLGMQEVTGNIAQASVANSEVTRDIALVKNESMTVAANSSDVKELARELKANAAALDLYLDKFTFKAALFDIGKTKDAHFNWKMRLTSVLSGFVSMDSKDIPNHHQCEFGKWYDNAPEIIKIHPLFKEIGIHHEAVHRKVAEAVDLYNMNKVVEAHNKVEEFEEVRKKLFVSLDEMYIS